MTKSAAILTGDLIGSTDAPEALEPTMARLAAAAEEIARWQGSSARFTRFRGDGWQIRTDPELALRAAVYLHACLRAQDGLLTTRIAIGLGAVESLGTADLSDARGAALTASGHALDKMRRTRRFAIAGTDVDTRDEIIVDLIEGIVLRWTRPQAEAAALALPYPAPTLEEIGRALGISPQAVSYRLAAGSVQSLRDAITAWEDDRGAREAP
ncbi:hypothetical protein GVY41_18620 [Frigidibacter albus]|uniref:Uncharacterized protein n=1 Tax=Frigidibacter albus TaxID=1465486 RepID=A0A6L8VLR8_9RHOB|nr:hypothetical protein [Frigidibacter albus]MZQ90711.1 hypothetical protein [Frigidibacter albus]NBE33018.1 hypothetical protein [Frigidibacter albus]GGH60121.1 hypothetical protein GCM10011341_32060 [Frigidibacter albus]